MNSTSSRSVRKRTLWSVATVFVAALSWATYGQVTPPDIEVLAAGDLEPTYPVSVVRHRWQVKIAESNHVTIRPGSVYDIVTYFEQNLGWPKPRFNYLFLDTGLGTADPIYPVFQRGRQASWGQLLPAMWSERNRHINHESTLETPEGCLVQSSYWVRSIDEFPKRYQTEREDGYELVDISFNYYTRLKPNAQCGRHRAHDPDPAFNPLDYIRPFAEGFESFADVPAEKLALYEVKIGLLKRVSEEFNRDKWPRFKNVYTLAKNSLWYYPDGVKEDYGVKTPRSQPGVPSGLKAGQMLLAATPALQARFPLERLVNADAWRRYMDFLDGKPVPGFDFNSEPGGDALRLDQLDKGNFYTAGLDVVPIEDVRADVSNPDNYKLVSVIARPYQLEADSHFSKPEVIPQLRFVYQLVNPGQPSQALEQLFIHLNFDVVERAAPRAERDNDHLAFIAALRQIANELDEEDVQWQESAAVLIETVTARPVQQLSFSSALTGIWVFGALSRAYNDAGELEALRVIREGVDIGYYSTPYDTVLFREALASSSGERRVRLQAHLDALTPDAYRDPRRSDPHMVNFQRMTCAQCHHMAGRDAVHVAFNDGLDRRFTKPVRATEFVYRELDRQLLLAESYWQSQN